MKPRWLSDTLPQMFLFTFRRNLDRVTFWSPDETTVYYFKQYHLSYPKVFNNTVQKLRLSAMSHLYQFKTCSCIQYVCIFHQVKKRKKRESKKVLNIINIKNNKYSGLEKVITAYIFKVQSLFIVIKCSDRWMSILPYSLLYRMSNHSHSYVFYFEK